MKRDLYVDNILSSVDGEDEAVGYFRETRSIMYDAGFNLRSWSSNCTKLIELSEKENVHEVKILGMVWNTETDKIGFQDLVLSCAEKQNITKREIL